MTTVKRVGICALCILCAAETAAIIAYYGAPVVRMALAVLLGLVIVVGMVGALQTARRGDLLGEHRRSTAALQPASVYRLPQAPGRGPAVTDDADRRSRVIRLDDR